MGESLEPSPPYGVFAKVKPITKQKGAETYTKNERKQNFKGRQAKLCQQERVLLVKNTWMFPG